MSTEINGQMTNKERLIQAFKDARDNPDNNKSGNVIEAGVTETMRMTFDAAIELAEIILDDD